MVWSPNNSTQQDFSNALLQTKPISILKTAIRLPRRLAAEGAAGDLAGEAVEAEHELVVVPVRFDQAAEGGAVDVEARQAVGRGGEPDVVGRDEKTDEAIFYDCSAESPRGRRSICYDPEALAARKENKPADSAVGMAADMGIELLTEEQYRELQKLGRFDTKTSSWLKTPSEIRKLGGAIFGDFRYGTVFVYHNGADSYYAARGFRGALRV